MRSGSSWVLVLAGVAACGSSAKPPSDAGVEAALADGGAGPIDARGDALAASEDRPGVAADAAPDASRDAPAGDLGPVDAPPSTCPSGGCGDAGTCWLAPHGGFTCAQFVPVSHAAGASCDGGPGAGQVRGPCCTSDRDCTERPRGRCLPIGHEWCGGPAPPPGNYCDYTGWCMNDGECPGGACVPPSLSRSDAPRCLTGPCRTSADCTAGPGGVCAVAPHRPCHGVGSLYCRYSDDVCRIENVGNDCPRNGIGRPACVPNPNGHGTRCIIDPPPPP